MVILDFRVKVYSIQYENDEGIIWACTPISDDDGLYCNARFCNSEARWLCLPSIAAAEQKRYCPRHLAQLMGCETSVLEGRLLIPLVRPPKSEV